MHYNKNMSKRSERSSDPRVIRTRRALHKAILELVNLRSLDTLSVADVTEKAQVNRATFYSHYQSLDELLSVALQMELENLIETTAHLIPPSTGFIESKPPPEAIVEFFRTLEQRFNVYRHIFGPHGSAKVVHELRQRITEKIEEKLRPLPRDKSALPRAAHAHALTGLLLGLLTYWFSVKPRPSAQRMSNWIWDLLTHSVQHTSPPVP